MMGWLRRVSASGMLGVTRAAAGRSLVVRAAVVSAVSRVVPVEATMTGSTTMGMFCCLRCPAISETATMHMGEVRSPVLTAAMG